MKPRILILGLLLTILACQVIPTPPALLNSTRVGATPQADPVTGSLETPTPLPAITSTPDDVQKIITPGELPPFPVSLYGTQPASLPDLRIPASIQDPAFNLPVSLENISNLEVADGLTNSQRATLGQNGFLVIRTADAQFSDIRNRVSLYRGQPYFLTSDAAVYAFHLSFSELWEALEKEYLHPRLTEATRLVLNEVLSYLPVIRDESLLKDARLAAAYLAVGLRLLDPQSQPVLDPEISRQVQLQIDQVMFAQDIQLPVLMPYFAEDFSAFHPVGHYFNDPALEDYYRGLTWFRRIGFKLSDRDPRFLPSKAPLIITMALRRASSGDGPAVQDWAVVNDTLAFLFGSGDDFGPRQYAMMMDQVYGSRLSILGISDELTWLNFQGLNQALPYSPAELPFSPLLLDLKRNRAWKFIGSRFTVDEIILQSLILDRNGSPASPPQFPSGLDLMAAFGSPAAVEALENMGAMDAEGFQPQLARIQTAVQNQSETHWNSSVFDAWLHTLSAQLAAKSGGFPHFMQNLAWDYKELNTALGSWLAQLHGAAVVSREPEIASRQVLPVSPPAPAFVEPNPAFFYQLANRSEWIVETLQSAGMVGAGPDIPFGLSSSYSSLLDLGDHFRKLGGIAEKELQGLPLDAEDYRIIQSPLGPVEGRALSGLVPGQQVVSQPQELPAIPMVSYIQADQENSLQVGMGFLNRIYVLVPLEGSLQIAQGGVFSYYEFPLPDEELMTDGRWRRVLLSTSNFKPPAWMNGLLSPEEGFPVEVTAFRSGDIYRITLEGGDLNIRDQPSIGSTVLSQLAIGTYVEIIDGPVQSQGFTWWKLRTDLSGEDHTEGWAVQNPAWYERAWGD